MINYFKNISNAKSYNSVWTTYEDSKMLIQNKGYIKGYISLYANIDDKFTDRTKLAFMANSFLPVKKYDVGVDEDGFALSEMLQFIWRSAIRNGEEIYVYIPSIRMRKLLKKWISENTQSTC